MNCDRGDDGTIREEEVTLVFNLLSKYARSKDERTRKKQLRKKPSCYTMPVSTMHPCSRHGIPTVAVATAFLPLPLQWHCFHRRATPECREAFPTQPLFSSSVPKKFHQMQMTPLNLVDLIKTSAVKTLWENHLLVGKRVSTHALPIRNRNPLFFFFFFKQNCTPFFFPSRITPPFS